MIAEGTYQGKIMDWGLKNYTKNNEFKIFVKFELYGTPSGSDTEVTWYGSIDDTEKMSKADKPYTLLAITKSKLKTLGFKYGEDLEALVSQPDPFDRGVVFSIQIKAGSKEGRSFCFVNDFWEGETKPKQVSQFSRELEKDEATAALRKVSKGATTEPTKKAVNSSLVDDEMPF